MGQCTLSIGRSASDSNARSDDSSRSLCGEIFDADAIISHTEWQQLYQMRDFIAKGGEGTVFSTIDRDRECNDIITKVYQFSADEYEKKLLRIMREFQLFNELELMDYKQIAFGPNDYEIYIIMERFDYTLHCIEAQFG